MSADKRRTYKISVSINGTLYTEVVIDSHYKIKHSSSINDKIILKLVTWLGSNGYSYRAVDVKGLYSFYVVDRIKLDNKYYKIIWLTEKNKLYIGVVNAYRR